MITRKCLCPCGREFQVRHESDPKQFFERKCSANHVERYRPKSYALKRGTSKPRARRDFQFCEAA
jgi:hypothetical protein